MTEHRSPGAGARKRAWLATLALMPAMLQCAASAQNAPEAVAVPLPPMGWSSWNSFSNTVDSAVIESQAKAMVATGMKKAGYRYINIDEGWWLGKRDAQGNIVVDPKAWPAIAPRERDGDMANIVRYIHGLGLKAGIYTDAGADGCGTFSPDLGPGYPHEGSEGHYEQDFLQFARWGFDYVKVDWCGGAKEKLDPAVQYAEIARAIARAAEATGHRLYFSICNWGVNSPWTWAPGIGGAPADIWRVSGDIVAPIVANTKNADRKASFDGMLKNFDQGIHPQAQHTGFYNDPDMMVLGMPGLDDAQNRVHMSLWAMSGAPLIVGADLAKLGDATLVTLTNAEVISVDQDALGLQAVKVAEPAAGLEVWSKILSRPGERAVLLLNRTGSAASITVRWGQLGLDGSAAAHATNLWSGKDLGELKDSFTATVPATGAVMLRVHGSETRPVAYKPSGTASPGEMKRVARFTSVASRFHYAPIQIVYRNPDKTIRWAELRVNGQTATRIAFPPTGNGGGAVWIQALFDRDGPNNMLEFSPAESPAPEIQSIAVE